MANDPPYATLNHAVSDSIPRESDNQRIGISHTFSGFFLGGGTEYAFSWFGPGWTIKTEYRLSEYSRDTFAVTSTPALAGGATVTMRPFMQTVRSELVYKFNWGR